MLKKLSILFIFIISLSSFSCVNNDDDDDNSGSRTFKVILNPNGGSMSNTGGESSVSYSVKYGETVTLAKSSELGLSRESYNFKGWSKSAADSQYTTNEDFKDGAEIIVRSNLTLYAIWSPVDPIYYYVSSSGSDSNDGTENSPYKTLTRAIKNIDDSNKDYIFFISGNIEDSPEFKDSYSIPLYANSITIKGKTSSSADSISGTISVSVPNKLTIQNLTIKEGAGVTLQGYKNGGCLFVAKSAFYDDEAATIYLKNVVIKSGKADYGAGIYNSFGCLTFSDCQIISNAANYSGGGIYNDSGILIISNSKVSENSAQNDGGGIFNKSSAASGTIYFKSGSFSENTASTGAGVFNAGTFNLTGGEISNNTASNYAGGICNSGTLTVESGSVCGNSAANSAGGIYNSGSLTVSGGAVSENEVSSASGFGGGVVNSAEGSAVVNGGKISENSAALKGAGVYNAGTFSLSSDIKSNTLSGSDSFGAGVYNEKKFTVTNGEISGNKTESGFGGGVANVGENAVFTFSYGFLKKNEAKNGGGLYNEGGKSLMSSMTIVSATVSGQVTENIASEHGGGVYLESGDFTISAGAIDSYGKRVDVNTGSEYYQGNKAGENQQTNSGSSVEIYRGSGNSWYKVSGTFTKDSAEETGTYSDDDVVIGLPDWVGTSD